MSSTVLKKISNDFIILTMLSIYLYQIQERFKFFPPDFRDWGYPAVILALLLPLVSFALSKSHKSIPWLFAFPMGFLAALRINIFDFRNGNFSLFIVAFVFGVFLAIAWFYYYSWKEDFKKHYDKESSVFSIFFLIAALVGFFLASLILGCLWTHICDDSINRGVLRPLICGDGSLSETPPYRYYTDFSKSPLLLGFQYILGMIFSRVSVHLVIRGYEKQWKTFFSDNQQEVP